MIIAVAKLISKNELPVRKGGLYLAASCGALILALALDCPVFAETQTNINQKDPSFAQIVISKSDYLRGTQALNAYVPLPEIARKTMYRYFGKELSGSKNSGAMLDIVNKLKVEPKFLAPAGVFVTLSKNGKTRGCWGSVYPRESNVARETVLATLGALSKEYRFKRISANELKTLKIQVTVVRELTAVTNIKSINPLKDGVMVRAGGRGGVILPGEAVDAYYELVLAKLKAGIKPDEPCQIYKIKAEIYD